MKKFRIVFDECEKGYLKNSDASAHFVDTVEAESIEDVPSAIFIKIKRSDRHQISRKPFKIQEIYEVD